MDSGFNNPTSWHWHAISPQGRVITFAEHYMAQLTVKQHAAKVKQIEREWGIQPDFRVGDPAIAQKSPINGNSIQTEYRLEGIPIMLGNNLVDAGLNRVASYLRERMWFITEDCPKLIWEMKKYRWKTRTSKKLQEYFGAMDQPHKKDDHAMDDTRYFFMSQPELARSVVPPDITREREKIQSYLRGVRPYDIEKGSLDPYVSKPILQTRYDSNTDEYMGGEW